MPNTNPPDRPNRWERLAASGGRTADLQSSHALRTAMRAAPSRRQSGRWAAHGISQAALADLVGCHRSLIGKLAKGDLTTISEVLARSIAHNLGVTPESLFVFQAPPNGGRSETPTG